jgi:hypothetical protein
LGLDFQSTAQIGHTLLNAEQAKATLFGFYCIEIKTDTVIFDNDFHFVGLVR